MKDYSYDLLMQRLNLDHSLDSLKKITRQLCEDNDMKRRNLGNELTKAVPRTEEIIDTILDLEKIINEISEYGGDYKVKK